MPESHKLIINGVIHSSTPDRYLAIPHRVLYIDEDADSVVLFRLTQRYHRPIKLPFQQLMDGLDSGRLVQDEFLLPPLMLLPESRIPSTYKAIRDKWWSKFETLLGPSHLPHLFDDFPGTIKLFAEEADLWRQTVYVQTYRFFHYGCVPNAFLPRFDLRGGAGKPRIFGTCKVGRPREVVVLGHNEQDVGINISDEDKAKFLVVLRRYWAIGEHATFTFAYKKLLTNFYADIKQEGKDGKIDVHVLERPTYRQFVHHAKKLPEFPDLFKHRVTAKRFSRKYRAITGSSGAEVIGPMQRWHIDATVADIYLVSAFNRSWIIGRPIVYMVTDVFSTKNVGIYCGLEGPSWEGARLALLNAMLPKDEFLRIYGLEGELTWDAHGIPDSIMGDRAELLSENALGLTTGLGITIDVASAYRPDLKGTVERKFGTQNEVIYFVPGAVLKRNRERGERNYALDATLNLWEFTRLVARHAIHGNEHKKLVDRLTPQMLQHGVEPTPNGLFAFGLEHLVGGPPHRSREEIYAHLLPQSTATVRPDGIFFEGLSYTSPIAIEERWFERARIHKNFSVPIRYNPEVPGRIWVVSNPEFELRSSVHEATLIDHYKRYERVQLDEIRDLHEFQKLRCKDAESASIESLIRNDIRNDRDLAKAQKDLRATTCADSPTQRVKNIRPRHAAEKQNLRQQQAKYESENMGQQPVQPDTQRNAGHAVSVASTSTPTNPIETAILQMLRSKGENT